MSDRLQRMKGGMTVTRALHIVKFNPGVSVA